MRLSHVLTGEHSHISSVVLYAILRLRLLTYLHVCTIYYVPVATLINDNVGFTYMDITFFFELLNKQYCNWILIINGIKIRSAVAIVSTKLTNNRYEILMRFLGDKQL